MDFANKRIMMLGGNYFQATATQVAKDLGCYVISVDYLPDNPGHTIADEYHNVSTLDKSAVLELAKELRIDGIMSYASDVSQPTVAYVAEQLGLPGNPFESVCTLTNKARFRKFMRESGLSDFTSGAFSDCESARGFAGEMSYPIIVKPADSSGSKGLTKLADFKGFEAAFTKALEASNEGAVIVEDYFERVGRQLEMEGFYCNGRVAFAAYMDQHQDAECAPFSPMGSSMPSLSPKLHDKAKATLEQIFGALKMRACSFNFEFLAGSDGTVFPLEIGPRNGGNMIPDAVKCAYGVDLAEYAVRSALGDACEDLRQVSAERCATCYLIHSLEDGRLEEVRIDPAIERRIVKLVLFAKRGDQVRRFRDARDGIGCMVLDYGDELDQMKRDMDDMNQCVCVCVCV